MAGRSADNMVAQQQGPAAAEAAAQAAAAANGRAQEEAAAAEKAGRQLQGGVFTVEWEEVLRPDQPVAAADVVAARAAAVSGCQHCCACWPSHRHCRRCRCRLSAVFLSCLWRRRRW